MIPVTALHWLLTVCFAVVAGQAAWRAGAARDGGAPARDPALERVTHALHALMAVAMAVMTWPWGMRVPARPQVVFFSLAAVWFLAAACFVRSSAAPLPYRVLHAAPHALAMTAAAWMADTMRAGSSVGGGESVSSMMDMPGMHMRAPGSAAAMTLTGSDTMIVLAMVFLALALRWLTGGFDLARSEPAARTPHTQLATGRNDLSYHDLMTLGMAVMLIVIA
ncbi:membrane protein [Microbispora sp. ATCC PTA-5024]|nr:membrane protein [Microbispora sp. ATCC PTA-5024]